MDRSIRWLLGCFLIPLFFSFSLAMAIEIPAKEEEIYFDIVKVFQSCPIIYTLLFLMSVVSLTIWLYSLLTLRLSDLMPMNFIAKIRDLFQQKQYDAALAACQKDPSLVSGILAAGLLSRKHGPQVMIESMKSEGRRSCNSLWQRISLLNEIAVVAPMLGLLGTVVGLFFAFYASNRSAETVASIFDGLGIAIGTTVVGLIVSIFSMLFYTTLKFRVVNLITTIENESLSLVCLVDAPQPQNPLMN